ncbi:mycothiol system anti-sigma-R factor [Demequina sp. NBRC 110053]|uniref:mycothiol system anti-sigma-R factor n=1 Tax=Demequina sp. NBRC 110053 TaxID=1570342 RepID=UPI0013563AA3|nr:mycothiol system anti-sigma-R factor [Demequina sp. NBRC 110053]
MPGRECEEALDRLFEYIDDELPQDELRRIGDHLKTCPPCEAEHKIKERIKNLTSRTGGETAPEELRERILASIRSAHD